MKKRQDLIVSRKQWDMLREYRKTSIKKRYLELEELINFAN